VGKPFRWEGESGQFGKSKEDRHLQTFVRDKGRALRGRHKVKGRPHQRGSGKVSRGKSQIGEETRHSNVTFGLAIKVCVVRKNQDPTSAKEIARMSGRGGGKHQPNLRVD